VRRGKKKGGKERPSMLLIVFHRARELADLVLRLEAKVERVFRGSLRADKRRCRARPAMHHTRNKKKKNDRLEVVDARGEIEKKGTSPPGTGNGRGGSRCILRVEAEGSRGSGGGRPAVKVPGRRPGSSLTGGEEVCWVPSMLRERKEGRALSRQSLKGRPERLSR